MKINNSDLRKLYSAYIQNRVPLSRAKCPSLEELLNIIMTSGSSRKKGKIIDHITSCAYCAQEFSFFLDLSREERRLLEEIEKLFQQEDQIQIAQKKGANSPIIRWLKLTRFPLFWKFVFIPLLAIVFISLMILATNKLIVSKKNEERGRLPGQIQLIAPTHEKAAQAPLIFKWKGVKYSDHYVLEIFDEALSPLWKSSRILGDSYQLPPDIAAKIRMDTPYFWMITVYLADGKVIESSLEDFFLSE
jgi:hypothetical protein